MIILRELTATSLIIGPFLDTADGFTAKTALVLSNGTTRLAKNGGAFAARSATDAAVHKENGYYGFNLNTVDTNTPGILMLCAVTTGALPVWYEILVMASPVYDSMILGSDRLQVDVEEIGAGIITATAIASNAITSAKIAADAIGASQIADNAIDAAAIATGAITSAKFAAGAITATVIATDAIDADALATDAVTEIRNGLGLASANLDTQLAAIAGYLDTEVAAILAAVDTEVAAIKAKTDQLTFTVANKVDAQAQLSTQGKADVNAEVVDAVNVDTYSELAALPSASPTIQQILMFLYEIARNKLTTTSTEQKLYKDNGSTVLGTWTVSDDGTTFMKSEIS